jgi:hypothetical protein
LYAEYGKIVVNLLFRVDISQALYLTMFAALQSIGHHPAIGKQAYHRSMVCPLQQR